MSLPDSHPLTPPATTLPIGTVIAEKYRVDGVLGAGGMGVVLSATHLDLDAPVAVKLVRDEFSHSEEVVSRMLQEARSAAMLRGRHMVRVLDVGRLENGTPYIVMERLAGNDLATILNEHGPLPVREALDYVVQACEGLAEAHALGIVHRDLKPENLFLAQTPEGPVVKILDFGVSKIITDAGRANPRTALTNAGVAVGSPYYMSPEQMRASPHVDARADIWSLGAVLFELLTGKCPFEGESLQVVCALVLSSEPPSLLGFSADTPEDLDRIVRRCLRKNPSERYPTVDALGAELRAFLDTENMRTVNRDLRLASGVSLVPKQTLAVTRSLVSGSSPTLPSRLVDHSPALGHVHDISGEDHRREHRGTWAAALTLAASIAAGVIGFWYLRIGSAHTERAPAMRVVATLPAAVPAPQPAAPRTMTPAPAAAVPAREESVHATVATPTPTGEAAPRVIAHSVARASAHPAISPPFKSGTRSLVTVNMSEPIDSAAAKSPSSPASASFDDLAPAAPSATSVHRPIDPWSTDSLGGRY